MLDVSRKSSKNTETNTFINQHEQMWTMPTFALLAPSKHRGLLALFATRISIDESIFHTLPVPWLCTAISLSLFLPSSLRNIWLRLFHTHFSNVFISSHFDCKLWNIFIVFGFYFNVILAMFVWSQSKNR